MSEDLRERLVAAGVELVTREGSEMLTLREIARRAGVSHGAPRRYFPTHLSLLSAIARQGFRELGEQVARLLSGGGTPHAQLVALGRAYVEYAAANRGMFELMFRHDLLESNQLGLRETSLPLFEVLVELVAQAGSSTPPGAPSARVAAAALWANLHGLAQLWIWGSLQLATDLDDVEPLLRAAVDAHAGPEAA
ncbi:TetR/AcrR family transcriptional regulator [Phytohabitans houttuyneae]|uniref:TetR family transcriptional regulator n=1 Tax=Phytohabitans houttuyneae TaxID=1076126 RepID=A0A6V8KKW0_9ACTN|nr:TetR/AcrR family transcriptional regulator [Phytohabitans houttuyneae]GFJ84070.1 TetR family transcriptional regulator [Phytohabitans houttuyneae]